MIIKKETITEINREHLSLHLDNLERLKEYLYQKGVDADNVIDRLCDFQVAIPSWALAAGATRFGRFSGEGEPRNLDEKIEDVGLLHALNRWKSVV